MNRLMKPFKLLNYMEVASDNIEIYIGFGERWNLRHFYETAAGDRNIQLSFYLQLRSLILSDDDVFYTQLHTHKSESLNL